MRPTPLIHFLSCKLNFFQHFHFCISLVCATISHYYVVQSVLYGWGGFQIIIKMYTCFQHKDDTKNIAIVALYNPPHPSGTLCTTGWYLIFRAWQGAAVLQSSSEGGPFSSFLSREIKGDFYTDRKG